MRIPILLSLAFTACLSIPAKAGNEDVIFKSGNVALAGTLMTPKGSGPFPAVVFIHGSGPETRKNSKKRAKLFVDRGFAALIYDKRGAGKSGGNPDFNRYFSIDTLAADVLAAVDFLTSRSEINSKEIGLVAASQGGWVATQAAKDYNFAFLIVISGSVTTVGEDNLFERSARLKGEGFTDNDVREADEMHVVDQEVSRSGNLLEAFATLWEQNKNKPWFRRVYLGDKPMGIDHPYRQWYRTVVDLDAHASLKEISIPSYWIYGEPAMDRFCPVELSVDRLKALQASGKPIEIEMVKGANHSLAVNSKEGCCSSRLFSWLDSIIK